MNCFKTVSTSKAQQLIFSLISKGIFQKKNWNEKIFPLLKLYNWWSLNLNRLLVSDIVSDKWQSSHPRVIIYKKLTEKKRFSVSGKCIWSNFKAILNSEKYLKACFKENLPPHQLKILKNKFIPCFIQILSSTLDFLDKSTQMNGNNITTSQIWTSSFNLKSSTDQQISLTHTHTKLFSLLIYTFVNLQMIFQNLIQWSRSKWFKCKTFQFCILVVLDQNSP